MPIWPTLRKELPAQERHPDGNKQLFGASTPGLSAMHQRPHSPTCHWGKTHHFSLAGHYPIKLAKAMVSAMEEELMKEGKQHDILVGEQEEHSDDGVQDVPSESSDEEPLAPNSNLPKISPAIRHAVRRLHENTGHRSNRRLARALMIANAPPEVVRAAKEHRCSICQERKAPKPQRPMSLPVPKEVFDQVHIDLLEEWDCQGVRYYIVHMIDHASRFQMGQVLPTRALHPWSISSRPGGFLFLDLQESWWLIKAKSLFPGSSNNYALRTPCCCGIVLFKPLGKMDCASVAVASYVPSWEQSSRARA